MIKKILLTFLFAFVCFLGIDNVYALNSFNGNANISGLYMTFSGSQLGINGTYSLAGIGQAPIRYEGHIEYPYDLDVSYTPSSLYSRTAFCYTGSSMSIISNSGVSLLQKTSIPCQQNLNNSTGHIYFVQRNFTPDVEDHNVYSLSDNYALRFSSDAEYISFYGLNYSYEPFPNYNETDILLKSNDDILNDLDIIKDNQEEIIYKLDETIKELTDMNSLLSKIHELLNSLFNTCRDSYNLWNNSQVSNVSDYIFKNDTGFKIVKTSNGRISPEYQISLDVGTYKVLGDFISTRPGGIGFSAYTIADDGTKTYFTISDNKVFSVEKKVKKIVFYLESSNENGAYVQVTNFMIVKKDVFPPSYESYGEEICKSKVDETNDAINESNKQLNDVNNKLQEQQDFMNDDDTSGSSSEAQEFFEGFDTDTYGLTSIITAPLELIGNIAGSTCSPLPLEIPFVGGTFNLPCMSTIYKKHFGSFLAIYQTITFGIVSYWVCVRIFALVKDFKNPEHDEIEVMDL